MACGEWNTYIEEKISKAKTPSIVSRSKEKEKAQPKPLPSIVAGHTHRIDTRDGELNRVLGGGLVHGSIVLVGGQPGIGKSTLMLQLAMNAGGTILYVSGEESEEQIKMRADRLGTAREECFIQRHRRRPS